MMLRTFQSLYKLCFTLFLIALSLKAQPQDPPKPPPMPPDMDLLSAEFLEVFELERGVRHSVTDVVQDDHGFLWFATDGAGLFRYDGHRLTSFQHVPGDPTSLPQNWLSDLFLDKNGHVWIGIGETEGLVRINRESGELQTLEFQSSEDIEPPNAINFIDSDHQGNLILNAYNGIFTVNPETGEFYPWQTAGTLIELTSVRKLENNRMLVGAKAGLFLMEDGQIIEKFAKPDAQRSSYTKILSDGFSDNFWVRVGQGSYLFNLVTKTFNIPNYNIPEDWEKLAISCIMQDSQDNGWVAIENIGLFRIDNENRRMLPLYSGDDLVKGESKKPGFHGDDRHFQKVSVLFEDRSGVVWVGSPQGLEKVRQRLPFKHTGYSPRNPNGLLSPEVRSFFKDHGGRLWIGTRGGLNWTDGNGYEGFQVYPDDPASAANRVMSIAGHPDYGIWFATPKGVYTFDPNSYSATPLNLEPLWTEKHKETGYPPSIETLIFDEKGLLWMGGKDVFATFNPQTQSLSSRVDALVNVPQGQRHIYNLFFAQDGVLWIAIYNGLYKKLPNSDTVIKVPLHESIVNYSDEMDFFPVDLDQDPEGNIWVTTVSGLIRWDPENESAKLFTTKDGLADNLGYAVAAVEDHLWISHPKGVTRYNPESRQALNYNLYDGLQNRFLWKSNLKSDDGMLYFGGNNGYNAFDPIMFAADSKPPELVFTGIHLDEKERLPGQTLESTDVIEVTYANEFIKVYFSVMDYGIPEKNLYSFRLNGDSEGTWTVPSNDSFAYLSHLSPGDYTLQVRGANDQGVWSQNEKVLQIRVLPPFWQTPIAYFLYVLAGVFLISLFYVIRTRQLSARARELEIQVAEQTRSLRLEKEKTEAQAAKLLEMDQLKSQFFSNVSHEFRTPLTLIIGPLESLMSATVVPAEELTRHHSVMLRNARRLLRLINQLLDISKLEAGRMQLLTRPMDSCRFLRPIVFAFQSLADKSRIKLEFECDDKLEPFYIDPEKMEKVMFNLLSNAFQFTPPGGCISVSVLNTERAGKPHVCISVADTGEGIAKADQELIFDRFRQADGSSTREKEGTGIGLSLVKELVELHHGTIEVESEKGKGATFRVSVPCGQAHLHPDEIVCHDADFDYALADDKANIEMAHLNVISPAKRVDLLGGPCGETILVVDDNVDIRQYVMENLSEQYRVIEAENGKQGLELIEKVKPDLIVTDVMMPVMDGYEMCRQIRANKSLQRIPIIMLTAKATDEMRVEGLEIGADEYLSKPFNVRELRVRVRNLLQIRGQEKQMRLSLEMAHKVQVSMLPLENPKVNGLEIASFCVPAREVGGDYFDFLAPRNGHCDLGVIIGDVSGKGMSAALYMTMTKGLVQAFGGDCDSPRRTLSLINRQFHRASAANAFLSLSYARIDTQSKRMIYASAGHNPPILFSPSRGVVEMVKSPGMAIGLESGGLFDRVTEERELQLDSGDILFFYTDGITEGMNDQQEIYGEDRLIDLIQKHGNLTANALLDRLKLEHEQFVNGMEQFDDMTAVVVKIP